MATTPRKRGGRSPKAIGYYHEKRMELALAHLGFKRMVMSGALGGDHSGDLRRPADPAHTLGILEVKRRSGGQVQLRRWLAQADAQGLLIVGERSTETLVVLSLPRFVTLLEEAGYCRQNPSG